MVKEKSLFYLLLFRHLHDYFSSRWSFFIKEPIKEILNNKQSVKTNVQGLLSNGDSSIYRLLFFLFSVFLLFLLPILSLDFGINWDEIDSESYGQEILKYILSFGHDKTVFDNSKLGNWHLIYFGSSFDVIIAFVNKFISPFGVFETRHFIVAICGFITMLFAALITKRISNWRAALLTLIFLLLSPRFFGHSMNSAKDMPFAVGYIVAIYFIIKVLTSLPRPKPRDTVCLILSIAFTISNKIPGLILVSYLGLSMFILFIYHAYQKAEPVKKFGDLRSYIVLFCVIVIFSYGLGIAFWPYAHSDLIGNPFKALKILQDISSLVTHYEIFEGVKVNMNTIPWYYTFKFIGITIPIFIIAGFLIFIGGSYWLVVKGKIANNKTKQFIILFLLFITFFPILYSIYKHSKLYNGWRHFLFIYPSFVIISTIGWEFLIQLFKVKIFKILVVMILILMISKPMLWMIKNHPNQIVYFNELTGGINGAYGKYETDPMVNSGRQAIEWLVKNENVREKKTIVITNIEPKVLEYYAQKFTDSIEFKWTREYNKGDRYRDYSIFSTRTYSPDQLTGGSFPPKGTIYEVKVDNIPLVAVIKTENNFQYLGYENYYDANYRDAVNYFTKAVKYDPNDEENYRMLGSSYTFTGNFTEAIKNLKKSISMDPYNFVAYKYLGDAFRNQKKYIKAINFYKKSNSVRHNYLPTLLKLGSTYYNVENYDSSIYWLNKAKEYFPTYAPVYFRIAESYRAMDQYNSAFKMYNKAIQLDPQKTRFIDRKQELKELIRKQKSLESDKFNPEFELVEKYIKEEMDDSALIILNKVIDEEPDNFKALLRRGIVNLNLGKYKLALKDLNNAGKSDSNNFDLFFNKGIVYAQLNKFNLAIENHSRALQISPGNYTILNERAYNYMNLKKYDLALEDFNSSIEVNDNQHEAFYGRAIIYYSQGKSQNTLNDLNKVILINPYLSEAYFLRSKLLLKNNQFRQAFDDATIAKNLGYPVDEKYINKIKSELEK